ncbi:MAG: hypothetical protein ACP5HU_08715, partial [Phycisphaerae bacterium]
MSKPKYFRHTRQPNGSFSAPAAGRRPMVGIERFINPFVFVSSLESYTMAYSHTYKPYSSPSDTYSQPGAYRPAASDSYGFLPSSEHAWSGPADASLNQLAHYLDPKSLPDAEPGQPQQQEDIVSAVLNRQIERRAMTSSQLA